MSVELVSRVMADVLGLDEVEPDEDFFALGGNSLDVGRLCAGLAGPGAPPVPFGQVYRTPTPRALGAWLASRDAAPATTRATPVGVPVPLTRGQANLGQAGDEVVCVLAWWLDGVVDLDALTLALGDVHRRHETLHCSYQGSTAVLPADPGEPEVTVLSGHSVFPDAEAALDKVVGEPLDIAAGRIWRAVVVPCGGRTLLGLGIHHIAFDGWSHALLVADLERAYQARVAGAVPEWPEPAPGLAALAAEEEQALAGTDLDAQRDFWRTVLRTVPRIDLPGATRVPVPAWGPKEGRRTFIPEAVLAGWDAYAKARRTTPFGYQVAVFAQLLRELTGRQAVAMMVPVAARGNPLLDAAVAARLDAVCLHLPAPRPARPAAGADDPVARAGAVLAAALAAQDLPFSAAATEMAKVRPDYHVLATLPVFLLQDNESKQLTLAGLPAEPLDSPVAREAPNALTVEVFRDAGGATVRVTVRTDRVPAELAERVAAGFARILCAGPEALAAAETSR